jgi:hypothetical protein
MEYKFNGKLTLNDFAQMNRFYMREFFLKRKYSVFFLLFIIFLIGSFRYNIILYNKIRFLEDLLPALIFGLAILFVIQRPNIMYKKYFEMDKISQEEQKYIVNENEINMSSENSYIKITKDKINKIRYDKDSIYIFIGENKVFLIKSRYLKDLTEFNELKDFIKLNYI